MWVKASKSGQGNCVEFKKCGGDQGVPSMILVRDSKHPERATLKVTPDEIAAMFDGVRKGEFDYLLEGGDQGIPSMIMVRDSKHPERAMLEFTPDEITAMFDGVRKGEFDYLLEA